MELHEHDTVELIEPHDGLPAGARGTLLSEPDDGTVLLEPAGAGSVDDLVDVPVAKLRAAA